MKTKAAETLALPFFDTTGKSSAVVQPELAICALFRSEAHNYFGHHGQAPGMTPSIAEQRVEVRAGQGVVGDRYFNYRRGYSGQITFFAAEIWERLQRELGAGTRGPEVFRRNVITRGGDLLSLVGTEFEVQGVRFAGIEHCKPCYWMDQAFAPGALAKLAAWKGGGLRAKILSDGWLSVTAGEPLLCSA